jgi:hypothetical protein
VLRWVQHASDRASDGPPFFSFTRPPRHVVPQASGAQQQRGPGRFPSLAINYSLPLPLLELYNFPRMGPRQTDPATVQTTVVHSRLTPGETLLADHRSRWSRGAGPDRSTSPRLTTGDERQKPCFRTSRGRVIQYNNRTLARPKLRLAASSFTTRIVWR